jgi:hypothetical protein
MKHSNDNDADRIVRKATLHMIKAMRRTSAPSRSDLQVQQPNTRGEFGTLDGTWSIRISRD